MFNLFGGRRGSTRNLCGSGKVSKANKRKRASVREDTRKGAGDKVLECSPELKALYESGNFRGELNKRTGAELKELCRENKIPRSGNL